MTSYAYHPCKRHRDKGVPCKDCRIDRGFDLPEPKELPIEEVKQHAGRFAESIFSSYGELTQIWERFGPIIHKRWMKKTVRQRSEVLLGAWPGMEKGHRPDFAQGFRSANRRVAERRPSAIQACLWPHVNVEDLSKSFLLVLFMQSRASALPGKFAVWDKMTTQLAKPHFSDLTKEAEWDMLICNRDTPETYGNVVRRDNVRHTSLDVALGWDPAVGLVILEIQDRTYAFLLQCARLILHDIKPELFRTAPVVDPLPPVHLLDKSTAKDTFTSLAANALIRAYIVPMRPDLKRMADIVTSRRNDADEHLYLLSADPGYFLERIREASEHSHKCVNHGHGNGKKCDECWAYCAAFEISQALYSLQFWAAAEELLVEMPSLEEQLAGIDPTSMRFAEAQEKKWSSLGMLIHYATELACKRLFLSTPTSPRLRKYFAVATTQMKGRDLEGSGHWTQRVEIEGPVYRVAQTLIHLSADYLKHEGNLGAIVQETQDLLDNDAAAADLIDCYMLEQFSEIALLSELRSTFDLLYPMTSISLLARMAKRDETYDLAYFNLAFEEDMNNRLDEILPTCTFGDLADGRLDYPSDKPRTAEVVEQLEKAEETLKGIWDDLHEALCEINGFSLKHALYAWCKVRQSQPKHVASLDIDDSAPLASVKDKPSDGSGTMMKVLGQRKSESKCAVTFTAGPESENKKRELILKRIWKPKTRGIPRIDAADQPAEGVNIEDADEGQKDDSIGQQSYKVPKRAFKTLSLLCPPAEILGLGVKEVSWTDLIWALNAIGLVPEKLYGSVWVFRPRSENDQDGPRIEGLRLEKSIQFHEPKEVRKGSKINTFHVKHFGARLKRVFGWRNGMWECE